MARGEGSGYGNGVGEQCASASAERNKGDNEGGSLQGRRGCLRLELLSASLSQPASAELPSLVQCPEP